MTYLEADKIKMKPNTPAERDAATAYIIRTCPDASDILDYLFGETP